MLTVGRRVFVCGSEFMAFSDFPMPEELPDFPHNLHIVKYFQSFANRFGLMPRIRFHTQVVSITPAAGNRWTVHRASSSLCCRPYSGGMIRGRS
jgi:cation diffusion facilitator CzcD-associated flavoprotein CzcO